MHCASRLLNASAPPSSASCCSGLILANDWICWAESFCSGSSHMHTQYWATSVPSGRVWHVLDAAFYDGGFGFGLAHAALAEEKEACEQQGNHAQPNHDGFAFFLRGGGWGRGRFRLLLGCGRGGHGGLGVVEVKEMRKPKNGKHAFGHLNAVSGCLWGKH